MLRAKVTDPFCHCTPKGPGFPLKPTLNVTLLPSTADWLSGGSSMVGFHKTVSVATSLVAEPNAFETTNE